MQIQLALSVEQVNQVLGALAQQPFAQVAPLIGEIKHQAEAQMQAENPAADLGVGGTDAD